MSCFREAVVGTTPVHTERTLDAGSLPDDCGTWNGWRLRTSRGSHRRLGAWRMGFAAKQWQWEWAAMNESTTKKLIQVSWWLGFLFLTIALFGGGSKSATKDLSFGWGFWCSVGIAYWLSLTSRQQIKHQLIWVLGCAVLVALFAYAQDAADSVDWSGERVTSPRASATQSAQQRAGSGFARVAIGGAIGVWVAAKVKARQQ